MSHAGQQPMRFGRSGLTLIELLLAVAITTLLIALVFSIYHTAASTRAGMEERRLKSSAPEAVLDWLAQDLTRAVPPTEDGRCSFTLARETQQEKAGFKLSFCTVARMEDETDLRWSRLFEVAYVLEADELRRESRPLTGPGSLDPPATNLLSEAVASAALLVYDGEEWSGEWDGPGLPMAARIEIEGNGGRAFQTEIFIPAGNPIPSTLRRAGGTAD